MTLRDLPSIDRLLQSERMKPHLDDLGHERVVRALRQAASEVRARPELPGEPGVAVIDRAQALLNEAGRPRLRRVINATGVTLHTNLGRSPLSERALARVAEVGSGYSNLEYDLLTGKRGNRHSHLKQRLRDLTGAPDALLVNNCAAAMVLVLDELARGRETVVSRGELVEIGGSFRIPDVLARSGSHLVEVGTTNCTYVRDYAQAITEATGLLLCTHLSNFVQVGFTHRPAWSEVVALGRERKVSTCLDLGSGAMVPMLDEPTVTSAVAAGFDVVAFSGDKLLGGPQIGIILGHSAIIERLAANPLSRALRPDKLSLAALEGTLLDYEHDPNAIPVVRMLSMSPGELERRARALAARLPGAEIVQGSSSAGGGSAPGQDLATWLVRFPADEEAARRLRAGDPPIVVRQGGGYLFIDPRTLLDGDAEAIVETLAHL